MAITDQLVRLMGGEIVVDSMPGRGSTFTVYLHLPMGDSPAPVAARKEETDDFSFEGRRILMAEDNETNAEIAVSILEEVHGAHVEAVSYTHLSQHLLSVINDILDLSRIEAGKIELEQKSFDLYALGDQLRSMFQKTVEAKGLRFNLEFKNFTARYVVGDQLRITQVLVNFLSNRCV